MADLLDCLIPLFSFFLAVTTMLKLWSLRIPQATPVNSAQISLTMNPLILQCGRICCHRPWIWFLRCYFLIVNKNVPTRIYTHIHFCFRCHLVHLFWFTHRLHPLSFRFHALSFRIGAGDDEYSSRKFLPSFWTHVIAAPAPSFLDLVH